MAEEEDPYAVSSDSDSEDHKPRPKIVIEGRANTDLNQLKSALLSEKESTKNDEREEELQKLKETADELKKMKKSFEAGTVSNISDELDGKIALLEERQKLTEIGKEKYSKFKTKFENIEGTLDENLEQRLKRMEKDVLGAGKEHLAEAKNRFEKGEEERTVEREKVEIERSADMTNIKAAFTRDLTADELPQECALCSTRVYPVERIFANKQLYHNKCFKCCKCDKKLTATNYNIHEGKLLCKVHLLEVFHPELARTMDPSNTEEDEHAADDDEEFAVSSKPKMLQNVVKSGQSAIHDELAQIRSLKDKKGDFESSVKEAANVEKMTKVEEELLQSGRVKANMDRFVSGAALESEEKKEKEELHFEAVGDIKNKWQTGAVETAEQRDLTDKSDLEALKTGPSVKERFRERNEAEGVVERQYDSSLLDTAAIAEARKSFVEGKAYEGAAVERSSDLADLKFEKLSGFKERFEKGEESAEVQRQSVAVDVDLGNIKAAFEKPEEEMTAEERAEHKKKEIEAEFLRYKLARKVAAERAKQQEESGEEAQVVGPGEPTADVGSIKDRFDKGDAFKGQSSDGKALDVDIKIAGKAREKFQKIDAAGAAPVGPQHKKTEPSKWDKKDTATAEVINRRTVDDDDEVEDPDAFDVKNLMNKFKNIGETASVSKISSDHRAELDAIKSGSKNLKERFERGSTDDDSGFEKKQAMQEEFDRLRKEREEAQRRLQEERDAEDNERVIEKDDVGVKERHASRMTEKFEKITAKEARKAEKGRMPEKKSTTRFAIVAPRCAVCSNRVYPAELFHCFEVAFHLNCFRCSVCRQALRVEKAQRGKDAALYCNVHAKLQKAQEMNNNNVVAECTTEKLILPPEEHSVDLEQC